MISEAYCPRNEIQKLESELWNLTVKGTDVVGYTQCFQELTLLCPRMVPDEADKVERQANNKRRMDNNPRDNDAQQPPYKRQNATRVYTARPSEKREYAGTLSLGTTSIADQRAPVENQRTLTCFECGNQGHYHSECPKLKNQNCENQTGNGKARGRVYSFGGGEADHDPNNIADDADA
ncbi:putative ribonuclease H-like domain-containing protein [Tanacetum coccineum]